MNGHLLPLGDVIEDAVVGLELWLVRGLEDLARELPCRAVDAQASDFPAPALGLLPAILEVAEAPLKKRSRTY